MTILKNLDELEQGCDESAIRKALEQTLDHFSVWEDREEIGDYLLRMATLIRQLKRPYDKEDKKLEALSTMVTYFKVKLSSDCDLQQQ